MRAVIQRVKSASVTVDGEIVGDIGPGLLILLGVTHTDNDVDIEKFCRKIVELRIFPDDQKPMNRSVQDIGGELLIVSQFTLYAGCRKGRRPDFMEAAEPRMAEEIYEEVIENLSMYGLRLDTGQFGAHMDVSLVNDGPVTIILDSDEIC